MVPAAAAAPAKVVIAHCTPTADESAPAATLVTLSTRVTIAKSPAITRPRTASSTRDLQPVRRQRPLGAAAEVGERDEAEGEGQRRRPRRADVGDAEEDRRPAAEGEDPAHGRPPTHRAATIGPSPAPTPRAAISRPRPRSPAAVDVRREHGELADHAGADGERRLRRHQGEDHRVLRGPPRSPRRMSAIGRTGRAPSRLGVALQRSPDRARRARRRRRT